MVLPVLVLAATLAMTLVVTLGGGGGGVGVVLHTGESEQIIVPNLQSYLYAGDIWSILDLTTSVSLPEYAFAQASGSTPLTFYSSELNTVTGVLRITFSETIDVTPPTNIVPTKIHIRESGNYTGGITLSADEFDTTVDDATIFFTLTSLQLATVPGTPELTIEPGAVQNTFGNLIDGTFDTSTITFVGATTLPSAQEDNLQDIAFSNNGTKMFVISSTTGAVTEYDLSTPFDASTLEFVNATSIEEQEVNPTGIAFSSDGTKMFVIGSATDNVNEYTLSAPFAASTLEFVNATHISTIPYPTGIAFSNDGTKMFVIDNAGKDVNEYDLDPPFAASTLKFVNATSIEEQEGTPTGIAFSNDGTKMFVIGTAGKDVNEYDLSTPFAASTLKFVNATSIEKQEVNPTGIAFSSDGAKMFVTGLSGKTVNAYALSSVYPITVTDIPVSNTPPALDDISSETVDEHEPISFNVTATDEDDDDALKYSLTGDVPDGATITSAGVFTWTPLEEQDGTYIVTVLVSDTSGGTDTLNITITVNEVNVAPVLYPIDSRNVTALVPITITADALDVDIINGTADALTFSFYPIPVGVSLNSTTGVFSWTPTENQVRDHIFVVSVTDGNNAIDTKSFTVTVLSSDTIIDTPPTINPGADQDVTKGSTVTLTGANATDVEDVDSTLEILWTQVPTNAVIITNATTLTPTIEVPSITTTTYVTLTMSVTDSGGNIVKDTRVLTIQDAVNTAPTVNAGSPLRVALGLSVSTNPTVGDPDGDTDHMYTWTQSPVNTITFSYVNSLSPTITAPANTTVTDVRLTLTVVDGEYTVYDETTLNIYDPATISNKKSSSSSSIAPIVDLSTLVQARIVDIPSDISEQISLHDASDPLEPILHNDTFDCPLTINEYCYLLDDLTNTLTPQTVTADQSTEIAFTVYTKKDLTHFTLYLNMQDNDVNYADSDTYITYTSDGTVEVTDPHGYIGSATVTVTQEDDQIPEKRTVRITIEFGEEPMGPTNMVAYMWNTDRKALFVKIIDAIEVVAAPLEPVMQAADPEPLEPDSELPADPEPVTPDFADDAADPEPISSDTLRSDDYDEAQVLHIIRMWSGFESEFITDTQLLELLGLEDYQDVDLPDWMMTELGVLVAKGDVTVGEFVLALQYVLTHA